MGYFEDNPINATGDPSRLSDLHCQHENTLEIKRCFERWHSIALTGANDGQHQGIDYYQGHAEIDVDGVATAKLVTYLDTIDSTLFGSGLWRIDVSMTYRVSGGTAINGIHHQISWGPPPATDCWSSARVATTDDNTAVLYAISPRQVVSNSTESDAATYGDSLLGVLNNSGNGRLIGKVDFLNLEPGSKVIVDYAIYKLF